MAILFVITALYCIYRAVRCFLNKRPPMYIEKDPDINSVQIREWNRNMGYSMLFWTAFALSMSAVMLFDIWPILIPVVLTAVGGVFYSMKASSVIRDKTGKYSSDEAGHGRGVAKKKKKRKK